MKPGRHIAALLVTTVIGVAPCAPVLAQRPEPSVSALKTLPLVWQDEFDGRSLDLSKWRYRYLGPMRAGICSTQSVSVADGMLRLATLLDGSNVLTGMIGTEKTFMITNGYFEARIKFPPNPGHHTCFWIQTPTFKSFPGDPARAGAELDIAEYFGPRPKGALANNVYWEGVTNRETRKLNPEAATMLATNKAWHDDFHIYGLLWTKDGYRFYVDGKETFRTSDGISRRGEYMILSDLYSDWEAARLPRDKMPDTMLVDYVRVFAPPPATDDKDDSLSRPPGSSAR